MRYGRNRCEARMKPVDYASPHPNPGTVLGFAFYDKDSWIGGAVCVELKEDGSIEVGLNHAYPHSGEPIDPETVAAVGNFAAGRIALCSGPGFAAGTMYVPAASTCPAWSQAIFLSFLRNSGVLRDAAWPG